jgi:hypothetical protein
MKSSTAPAGLEDLLRGLSAPVPLVEWARTYPDLETCWDACPLPDWQLWLAARLAGTPGQRCEVVACVVDLARRAKRGVRRVDVDPVVADAIGTVEAWAWFGAGHAAPCAVGRAAGGTAAPAGLKVAERAVFLAAARATAVADEESASSRLLLRSVPRGRASSFGASPVMSAYEAWRAADRTRLLTLAVAWAVRAAVQAGEGSVSAGEWADCVSRSAACSRSVLPAGKPGERRWARAARRRLRRPGL